jgi:hypothetical protein
MTEPTSSARDSSLQDRKAPGNFLRRTSQPRLGNIVTKSCGRHKLSSPSLHPIATPLPSVWLSFLVMPSSRSAAELKAPTTAADAALARSEETTRAS